MTEESQLSAIESMIAADRGGWRSRVRELRTPLRISIAVAIWLAIPVVVFITWLRVDFLVYPKARMAVELAVLAVASTMVFSVALRPLYKPPIPRWMSWISVVVAVAAVAALVILPIAHMDHPASLEGVGDDFARRAIGCFVVGVVLASIAFAAMVAIRRTSAFVWPALLVCSLAGLVGLVLHCPLVAREHILAGHTTVVIAALALSGIIAFLRKR